MLLSAALLISSYQRIRSETYQTIEQTCRRIATDFEARLSEKVGFLKGVALNLTQENEREVLASIYKADPDILQAWVRRPAPSRAEPHYLRDLYNEVQIRGTEYLSAPDFRTYRAALGVPVFRNGRFEGVLCVGFSLGYFQKMVESVHLFSTGYAFMVSHQGDRIAHPDQNLVGKRIGGDVTPAQADQMLAEVDSGRDFWLEKKALLTGKWSRQFYSAIRVGTNPSPWYFAIVAPEDEAVRDINGLFLLLLAGLLATLLVVAVATWSSARSITLPLRRLAAGAESIAAGHLETRVTWNSRDEVGVLAGAFNRMTDQLVQTLKDQEELVLQRTAKLIHAEKLAVLGQLTATIAHEINTPLGAIRSSATALNQGAAALIADLPDRLRSMDAAEVALYRALVLRKGGTLGTLPGAEERRRRRGLAARLSALGIPRADELADEVVFLSPPEDEEAMLLAIHRGQSMAIRLAAEVTTVLQSAAIILEAGDRASATVTALVGYARLPERQSDQTIDPAYELDTILTLYYGLSRKGVTVTKEYEPGLNLRGDRDRLNQVWVNLINNALQAMNYRGHLRLTVQRSGPGVSVSIANDGPPIPSDLSERIFEPFFTTKKVGEGTGLGLDICRRIVEVHEGSLTLSQKGDFTVFTVWLPDLDRTKPVH